MELYPYVRLLSRASSTKRLMLTRRRHRYYDELVGIPGKGTVQEPFVMMDIPDHRRPVLGVDPVVERLSVVDVADSVPVEKDVMGELAASRRSRTGLKPRTIPDLTWPLWTSPAIESEVGRHDAHSPTTIADPSERRDPVRRRMSRHVGDDEGDDVSASNEWLTLLDDNERRDSIRSDLRPSYGVGLDDRHVARRSVYAEYADVLDDKGAKADLLAIRHDARRKETERQREMFDEEARLDAVRRAPRITIDLRAEGMDPPPRPDMLTGSLLYAVESVTQQPLPRLDRTEPDESRPVNVSPRAIAAHRESQLWRGRRETQENTSREKASSTTSVPVKSTKARTREARAVLSARHQREHRARVLSQWTEDKDEDTLKEETSSKTTGGTGHHDVRRDDAVQTIVRSLPEFVPNAPIGENSRHVARDCFRLGARLAVMKKHRDESTKARLLRHVVDDLPTPPAPTSLALPGFVADENFEVGSSPKRSARRRHVSRTPSIPSPPPSPSPRHPAVRRRSETRLVPVVHDDEARVMRTQHPRTEVRPEVKRWTREMLLEEARRRRQERVEDVHGRFHPNMRRMSGGDMAALRPVSHAFVHRGQETEETNLEVVEEAQTTSNEERIFEASLRDTKVTRREHRAFGAHRGVLKRDMTRLSVPTLRAIRQKLRAAAYVGTKGMDVRVLFSRFDESHDGTLSRQEFVHHIRKVVPLTSQEMRLLWRRVDVNKSGTVDVKEFVRFVESGPTTKRGTTKRTPKTKRRGSYGGKDPFHRRVPMNRKGVRVRTPSSKTKVPDARRGAFSSMMSTSRHAQTANDALSSSTERRPVDVLTKTSPSSPPLIKGRRESWQDHIRKIAQRRRVAKHEITAERSVDNVMQEIQDDDEEEYASSRPAPPPPGLNRSPQRVTPRANGSTSRRDVRPSETDAARVPRPPPPLESSTKDDGDDRSDISHLWPMYGEASEHLRSLTTDPPPDVDPPFTTMALSKTPHNPLHFTDNNLMHLDAVRQRMADVAVERAILRNTEHFELTNRPPPGMDDDDDGRAPSSTSWRRWGQLKAAVHRDDKLNRAPRHDTKRDDEEDGGHRVSHNEACQCMSCWAIRNARQRNRIIPPPSPFRA